MKKIFILLVTFILVGCSSNTSLIKKEKITDNEIARLTKEALDIDFKKISFNFNMMEKVSIESYELKFVIYEDGKIVDEKKIRSYIDDYNIEKNTDIFYILDSCDDEGCSMGFFTENSSIISYMWPIKTKNRNVDTPVIERPHLENTYTTKIEPGKKYIIDSIFYYDTDPVDELDSENLEVDKDEYYEAKAKKVNAAVLFYVIFHDKEEK